MSRARHRGAPSLDDAPGLAVIDLDDPSDAGPGAGPLRADRYVALPGAGLVPRRPPHADRGARGPAVVLGTVLALFLLGAWLDSAARGRERTADPGAMPAVPLSRSTGTALLLLGGDGDGARLVVDRGRVDQPPIVRGVPAPVDDAVATAGGLVVRSGDTAARLVPGRAGAIPVDGPISDVFVGASGRVWLTTAEGARTRARELDVASGAVTAELVVDGEVRGAVNDGLVTATNGALVLVPADGTRPRVIADDLAFVAASADHVATRPDTCAAPRCDLVLLDVATGARSSIELPAGSAAVELASFSPGGRRLAVLRSDGTATSGVIIDIDTGRAVPTRNRAVRNAGSDAPVVAWSADGRWLFLATASGGVDAVGPSGETYRVDVTLPRFDALLVAPTRR